MFNDGELAFVANVGSLAYPFASRNEYINDLVPRPPNLFSHSDQGLQWQTSIADKAFSTGWGGRVADLMNASYNPSSKVSMSINLSGFNSFQVGSAGGVSQYTVLPKGIVPLSGYGTNYASGYVGGDPAAGYTPNLLGQRLKAFDSIMNLTHDNLLENEYNKTLRVARGNEQVVLSTIDVADATGVDFDAHFAQAQTSLGDQLKMVAKLIAGRNCLENNRQVFYVVANGYDNHKTVLDDHALLMDELSQAFLKEPTIDAFDNTVAFTASDFGRSLTPNGSDLGTAGSDHAWGGNAIVMGGAVQGKDIYGHYPSLKIGDKVGSIDTYGRGALIPDISVDQYSSTLAKWFGVSGNAMDTIFPNLHRFDDPLVASTNLQFLPVV
jgi:uncharacterized protein (DUF1501 family)